MQDKDFDIIIIKSEQPHMVREKSCTKTIKLKASQWTEIHEILIFQPEELTKSKHTLFYNLLLCSACMWVYAWSVPWALLGVYSMLQE